MEPASRPAQASETLRIAAENYRYGILTTERLFAMVRAVLARPDDEEQRAAMRRTLLEAVGEVPATVVPAGEPE